MSGSKRIDRNLDYDWGSLFYIKTVRCEQVTVARCNAICYNLIYYTLSIDIHERCAGVIEKYDVTQRHCVAFVLPKCRVFSETQLLEQYYITYSYIKF